MYRLRVCKHLPPCRLSAARWCIEKESGLWCLASPTAQALLNTLHVDCATALVVASLHTWQWEICIPHNHSLRLKPEHNSFKGRVERGSWLQLPKKKKGKLGLFRNQEMPYEAPNKALSFVYFVSFTSLKEKKKQTITNAVDSSNVCRLNGTALVLD